MSRRRSTESMRRFYDWFYRFYGLIERNISPAIVEVLDRIDSTGSRFNQDTILELACGSANLGLLLAPRAARYEGRDQSGQMLERAIKRWQTELNPLIRARYPAPPFKAANLMELAPGELGSPDWIMMSYALHLFEPADEIRLLNLFFRAVRKGVIIIDHEQRWSAGVALVERLEGSWYDQYVGLDFQAIASAAGVQFRNQLVAGCQVMEFMISPDGG